MTLPATEQPGPVFVVIEYSSSFGPHTMVRPLRNAWTDTGTDLGTITPWNEGTNIDVLTMITDWLTLCAVIFPSTVTFSSATLYTQPDPDIAATPRALESFTIGGTGTGTTWSKAVQVTFSMRDRLFKPCKVVLLDCYSGNGFDPSTYGSLGVAPKAVVDSFMSDASAWASRAGNQPHQFIRETVDLNDKLRRAYRMT